MQYVMPIMFFVLECLLTVFSDKALQGALQGLRSACRVVLGGLFPASVLLRAALFSPLGERLSRLISKTLLWRATGLSEAFAPSVVAGQLAGLPMGAALIKSIPTSETEKGKAVALASAPSPVFLISIFGARRGAWIWLTIILSLWTCSFLLPAHAEAKGDVSMRRASFSEALDEGISSSLKVASLMVLFSSIIALLPEMSAVTSELVAAVLELATGVMRSTRPETLAIALSFCGISAFCQISSLLPAVPLTDYLVSRAFVFLPLYTILKWEKLSVFICLFMLFLSLGVLSARKAEKRINKHLKKRASCRII